MKNLFNYLKEEWYKYLLEIIVITVGSILGAFALDNWNEDRRERLSEIIYLNELLEDFKNNHEEYLENYQRLTETCIQI